MQLFSANATMFSKKKYFARKKLLRKTQIHFDSLLPAQPKQPKQKNSCSKMWLIDQLYIELGQKAF